VSPKKDFTAILVCKSMGFMSDIYYSPISEQANGMVFIVKASGNTLM
jgi:hypothetical protein